MKIKMIVLAGIMSAIVVPIAHAQNAQQSQNEAISGAQSNVYMNNPDNIRSTLKAAPGIGGGGLTTSNDTCAGSFNLGGSLIGGGAIAGKTYEMEACVRMKEAYFLEQKGFSRAATARFCQGRKVMQAMRDAGTPCPQDRGNRQYTQAAAPAPVVNTGRYSDLPSGTRYSRDGGKTWRVK